VIFNAYHLKAYHLTVSSMVPMTINTSQRLLAASEHCRISKESLAYAEKSFEVLLRSIAMHWNPSDLFSNGVATKGIFSS